MKSISILTLMALPCVLASFQLDIVVREDVYKISVAGQGDPDKEIVVTNGDTYAEQGLRCLDDNHQWAPGCPEGHTKYRQVGLLNFTNIPEGPQPFTIAGTVSADAKRSGMRSVSHVSAR